MKFTKMHGNGNDFVVVEDLEGRLTDESSLAKRLCHRNFGIGADGILLVRKSNAADIRMVIINADGSLANMCGNGIRCFAKYVWENKLVPEGANIKIETDDGIKTAYLKIEDNTVEEVTIYMGKPDFTPARIPVVSESEVINSKLVLGEKEYAISTVLLGVPHTIIFGDLCSFKVEEGKAIEKHYMFPQGTNVNFCQVVDRRNIKVMTWERGAGATLACGTGSCASVVAANRLGFTDNEVTVEIPGGRLFVKLSDEGVYMTGPALTVFSGEITL